MKTCSTCGGRPNYPLVALCRFCLQDKVDREVGLAVREIVITQPSDIVPHTMTIVTGPPAAIADDYKRGRAQPGRVVSVTVGGRIVYA